MLAGSRFWCARFRRGYQTFAQACRTDGVGFSSATPWTSGYDDAAETFNRGRMLVSGDRIPATMREAPGSPRAPTWSTERLAGRGPGLDPAQGTPPPRRQLEELHRLQDGTGGSRLHSPDHTHPECRCGATRRVGNCATANTPGWRTDPPKPRPSAGATCPVTRRRERRGWKSSGPQTTGEA